MDLLKETMTNTSMCATKNRIRLSSDELKALDLLKFNHGANPFPGDESVANAFRLGIDYYRNCVERVKFTGAQKVLDLGCGFGRWSPFLGEANARVVALDRSQDGIRLGRNLCQYLGFDNIEFSAADVSALKNFKTEEYDFVWMWSFLQYVDRGFVLDQVGRILKPGGRFFVGNYGSAGLMVQHLIQGIKKGGTINDPLADWAKKALLNGDIGPGNPNYGTVEHCEELCAFYGLKLIRAAPQGMIDLRNENGLSGTGNARKVYDHLDIAIEFAGEKPRDWALRDRRQTTVSEKTRSPVFLSNAWDWGIRRFKSLYRKMNPHKT